MPRRKRLAVNCIAQFYDWPDMEPATNSIYLATSPSSDPMHVQVQRFRNGAMKAKIIDAEDLKETPCSLEISLVHRLLRENEAHGTTQISDVMKKSRLGIEIVTQETIARFARRHPAGWIHK